MNNIAIKSFKTYRIPAGWRDWLVLKVESNGELAGFSEFTDSNGSVTTLLTAIDEIGLLLKNKEFESIEEVIYSLRRKYRQSLPGIMFKAISAFENALWDLYSKQTGKPLIELIKHRNLELKSHYFKCYWSHCPTTRLRANQYINSGQIKNYKDLTNLGSEISDMGFTAFKTNLVQITPEPNVLMPGFNKDFNLKYEPIPEDYPKELNKILTSILSDSNKLEIIVDFNFNVNSLTFNEIQTELSGINARWLEIDFDDFILYDEILNLKKYRICTGENLLGLNSFEKVIYDQRVDIISIDVLWNGLTESIKIAELAITNGKKIAVHNCYGSLATSIALVFLSMLPIDSVELLEFDFDDVPWRDLIVSNPPTFMNGSLKYEHGLGWNNAFVPNKIKL
jgi:L-alanine-DL-glutamate epimerase-like enolase superfamily enzyme